MILPRGELRHQNLLTAYTDFPALLSMLKSEGFSGIVEIDFPETKGALFIDSGEIINAEMMGTDGAKRRVDQEVVQTLITLSNKKDGVLNVYRLAPEQVAVVANNLQHEILFKGLSTDFTRLDRLLLKLREEKHNGFIEVLTKEHQALGVLFLEAGEPVEMFTIPESGPSVFGRKSIPIFVENAVKQGAILNIYKSQQKIYKEERIPKKEEKINKKEEMGIKKGDTTIKKDGEVLQELILILQEILSKSEKFVDASSRRKGLFIKLFKESLIEKSEEFAFLDPFAGEFEYREGTIQFTGEVGAKDFTKGFVECLVTTLSHLEKELPKEKMLPLKLKAGIEFSLEQHSEVLKRLGVEAIVSPIFK